ncbi:MAG: hydroxyacid dehydrogenase [Microbacterium sp.]|uniref:NAD(P)-dependent oxidoreductase n=1 Tax=unclassified Microbacterium TaxID=2609290 RepID=UPI000C5C22D0|nr:MULTISPECIES: NAD(P)-dependent oxidoreductase [unclassified Microbacterium]MAY50267.1 hydroxyacid dehydrogenase [Microbacterium sp.]HBR88573.1 hydroxyacid dehydrogenase [Microbacterium sp.]HBS73100.1 hydroxyacid dehydrogenase [Microbacterium sp.]|tara:strand:+ start:4523 stop:5476 length:954 start_codon:yes stop_codon:yes gene_type:complete
MAVILVTSRSFGDGDLDVHARAAEAGHTIVRGPAHHPLDDLAGVLPTVDAWIAGTGPITTAHLDLAPRLVVIARYGVGVEAVDVAAAIERGIVVSNTPGANAEAVADHTVGLALAALRSTVDGDRRVRSGDWTVRRGRELGASTVGIVGFGRIGRGVARRLQGFGSDVLATDPFVPAEDVRRAGAEPATLDEIFAKADVITLHAPGGQVIVDEERIARLRRGAVIVNCARPDLVDEPALAAALADGRVGAYAADVLTGDTAGHDSPLLDAALADRVVITPHLAAQTTQAVDNMGAMALESALAVLAGEPAPYAVTST